MKKVPLGGGIELFGSSSCLGPLRSLLNTEGILTLPSFCWVMDPWYDDHRNQTTSAIRNHHISTKHPKEELKDFTIIDRESNTLHHQAKEALYIHMQCYNKCNSEIWTDMDRFLRRESIGLRKHNISKNFILECPSKLLPNPGILSINDLRILDVSHPHNSIVGDILWNNPQWNKLKYNNISNIGTHIN